MSDFEFNDMRLVTAACVKCGHYEATLVYGVHPFRGVYGEKETLHATCRRCGFMWTETPLDEVEDE